MVNLESALVGKDWRLREIYGFIATDRDFHHHLFVVGEKGTIIDLSSNVHEESSGFDTVYDFIDEGEFELKEVFENFDDFTISLDLERGRWFD